MENKLIRNKAMFFMLSRCLSTHEGLSNFDMAFYFPTIFSATKISKMSSTAVQHAKFNSREIFSLTGLINHLSYFHME